MNRSQFDTFCTTLQFSILFFSVPQRKKMERQREIDWDSSKKCLKPHNIFIFELSKHLLNPVFLILDKGHEFFMRQYKFIQLLSINNNNLNNFKNIFIKIINQIYT